MTPEPHLPSQPDGDAEPLVSVVVMAWNEVSSLSAVVGEIHSELSRLRASYEILIIDDGSTDGTGKVADELARTIPGLRTFHHGENRGLGGVYRTAFAQAKGRYLTFFPADGQFPASILGVYLPAMSDADMILGVLPERERPMFAQALSLAERLLLRVLFARFPRFQGILMFRRELLRDTPLHSRGRGWTVLMEFILRKAQTGVRIKNITIPIRPRASGASKVNNLRSILSNLRQVIELRLYL